MIKQLEPSDFSPAAEAIRASFATVAKDLGLTEQNCPKYVGFVTTGERLQTHHDWGWRLYGLFEADKIIGYVSVSKVAPSGDASKSNGAYEIHNLAVLPEHRHKGYGKQLLDFCMAKIKESCGSKVNISIVEENTVLKKWYTAYGFIPTGTQKYEHLPFTSGYMELEVSSWV